MLKSVSEACEVLQQNILALPNIKLPIVECLNLTAAESVFAPIDVPVFDNSAMDGYGIRFKDYEQNIPIKITTTVAAGDAVLPEVHSGEAVRIFTGAPIPKGVDTVVQQEICMIENGILAFTDDLQGGSHIRKQGTQTQKGSLILEQGTLLTAEYIGFLATFGIQELTVFSTPKVGIIVTGKELVSAGNPLLPGQIYESNGITLQVALQQINIKPQFIVHVDDDIELLSEIVSEKINEVDVLIFTGGISVGDYDFVKPVLERLGVTEEIYKVKQKPGKPLFFGTLNNKVIFALPGNPASVLTCFHVYVKRYLQTVMGQEAFRKKEYAILLSDFQKKSGITQFVKASVYHQKVEILSGQLSYQMDAYKKANAYAILPEGREEFQIGEKVEVIYF